MRPSGHIRQIARRAARAAHTSAAWLAGGSTVRALRGLPDGITDAALATVLLIAMLIERMTSTTVPGSRLPPAIALSVVIAGCLAARRRAPLVAYLIGSSALVAEALWVAPSPVSPYANLIGVYSLGLYASRGRARWGPLLVLPGVFAYFSRAGSAAPALSAGVLFSWLLAWAVGYSGARRREEQEAGRQAMRHQAVADERSRLARELHDLVGHTVNVMVVQAGAGRRVLDHDPAKAREILAGLEEVGRSALTELDRMLGVLRPDAHTEAELTAQPGIAELPQLVRRMTEAGVRTTLRIAPPAPKLTRSLDVSTYRIIQEALTNALKHGRARTASVSVRHEGNYLEIEVCDNGRGAPTGYLPGRGLLGITERVGAFGGSIEHGNSRPVGFRLRAMIPAP